MLWHLRRKCLIDGESATIVSRHPADSKLKACVARCGNAIRAASVRPASAARLDFYPVTEPVVIAPCRRFLTSASVSGFRASDRREFR